VTGSAGGANEVRFIEDFFPLLVCVAPHRWDDAWVSSMMEGYEGYFRRGERYALITHTPRGGGLAGAKERRRIADWANSPRVRKLSVELCVGSCTVVRDPFTRAAITAVLWFWKPASPHRTATAPAEAVDWCFERMRERAVAVTTSEQDVRQRLVPMLDAI